MKSIKIFPSLISADLLHLGSVIEHLEPHCDGFHIDVMDNHFVPNLTWGHQFVNAIAQATRLPLFVHLMIEQPAAFIKRLTLKPESTISFHLEATQDIKATSVLIKQRNLIPSIAIKPSTPLDSVLPFLDLVDNVLLMSVEPGFSGQQFLPQSIERLHMLKACMNDHKEHVSIAMDGGIDLTNIALLAANGATEFGIASAIFNAPDPLKALKQLYYSGNQGLCSRA